MLQIKDNKFVTFLYHTYHMITDIIACKDQRENGQIISNLEILIKMMLKKNKIIKETEML